MIPCSVLKLRRFFAQKLASISFLYIKVAIIILIFASFSWADDLKTSLELNKVMYKPDENLEIRLEFLNSSNKNKDLKVKLSISKPLREIYRKEFKLSLQGKENKIVKLTYNPQEEFGYLIKVKVFEQSKEVANIYKVINILLDWKKQFIMTTGIKRNLLFLINPEISDMELESIANKIKDFGNTVVQFYDAMPNYGVLYSDKDLWIHSRSSHYKSKGYVKDKLVISKEKMKKLIKLLHERGIKTCYYDEMGANDENGFRKDFAIYQPLEFPDNKEFYSLPFYYDQKSFGKKGEPLRLYGGYSADGNPFKMKDYYAKQLRSAVTELEFDAIFYDSLVWLCEASSFGYTFDGKKINLLPDEICYDFIKTIKENLNKINPEFAHIINGGIYKNFLASLPKSKKEFIWTLEYPHRNIVEKAELYPQTYSGLNNLLGFGDYDLIIYQPFFNFNNPKNYKTLMAITFSNGVNIYHRPDYFLEPQEPSIKNYNEFIIYFGEFFYDKDKKEKLKMDLSIVSEHKVLHSFYKLKNYIIINLINSDPTLKVWEDNNRNNLEDIKIKLPKRKLNIKNVSLISPDWDIQGLKKLDYLEKQTYYEINIPELKTWNVILIEL